MNNKNMKQLLSLFLFLLPCLAWAQYPTNGNQKITLGEQTTADGLVYRGVAATDTVRKPSIDTMAYMVLDTTTNIMWHYKKATNNAWLRIGGSITSGLTGTLPVANGGTGASVKIFVDTINTQTINGKKTFTDTVIVNKGIRFPSTQSASTNVNTLDDYEEGSFSVQLKFGGNNTGYTFYGNAGVFGKYTKIGDVVCVTIMVGILSKAAGASTGAATITGLPFTSASNGVNLGGGINISDAISIDGASFYMQSNSTTLVLQNGNGVNLTDANFGAFLGEIHMNFVYQVN
jgi:hypothetical protein